MKDETLQALLDELNGMEKDAYLSQAARFVGSRIMAAPGAIGRWTKARPGAALGWAKKQPGEFVRAAKMVRHPVKSVQEGLRHMTPAKQIPHMKAVVSYSWRSSKTLKGFSRIKAFLSYLFVIILNE